MGSWQIFFVVICVTGGAGLAVLPFLLDYWLAVKLAEARAVGNAVERIRDLEGVAQQISSATGHWQVAQAQAEKVSATSKAIADRMTSELQGFADFMERANDGEKATLRLEVEKLRRAESEWIQVLVRVLDHVFAIHLGAMRSGQPTLIEQIGNFQTACRDAARKVGLAPFTAAESEPFDPQRHQLIEGDPKAAAEAVVEETVAAGYTFQGRLLRPALVRLRGTNGEVQRPHQPAAPRREEDQSQLGLEDRSKA